mmetsp:Transcript_4988/g.5677  ORF Transcript_4988/g.5677 Transcript_4988/m.5677 type:complete len:156 (-) Transcript_4988:43-510(-)
MDAALYSVAGHGLSCLALAMRMSAINTEQMQVIRAAVKAGQKGSEAARRFLRSPYYRSWSRAQLNNAEYAPMLALLAFVVKYKADKQERHLSTAEKVACVGSVVFSYVFCYACATQGALSHADMRPGRGGMSVLRPIGALGRYLTMAMLVYHTLK